MSDERVWSLVVMVVGLALVVGVSTCTMRMNENRRDTVQTVCGGDLKEPARAIACHRLTGTR